MTIPIEEKIEEESIWMQLHDWQDNVVASNDENGARDRSVQDESDDSTLSMSKPREDDNWFTHVAMKQRCFRRYVVAWPRLSSLFLGVMVPLAFLIILSQAFGILLAFYEAPREIAQNDANMAGHYKVDEAVARVIESASLIPQICYSLFVTGRSKNHLGEAILRELLHNDPFEPEAWRSADGPLLTRVAQNQSVISLNISEGFDFMKECGEEGHAIINSTLARAMEIITDSYEDFMFNWIRCIPGAGNLSVSVYFKHTPDMHYEAQAERFKKIWIGNQMSLFEQYLQEYNTASLSPDQILVSAWERSVRDATGIEACGLNSAAAAWFWFIVMSTVGYGNATTQTMEGRAMVYTLGFVSILCFMSVLGAAGFIVVAIFDDAVQRTRLHPLVVPWIACLFWGAIWYCWMIVIALITMEWKKRRREEHYTFDEMYWFAYISTTTVGLGDLYVDAENFVHLDLLFFPVTFLCGFVFLSAFLGKFTELIKNLFLGEGKKSIVQSLVRRMDSIRAMQENIKKLETISESEEEEEAEERSETSEDGEGLNDKGPRNLPIADTVDSFGSSEESSDLF